MRIEVRCAGCGRFLTEVEADDIREVRAYCRDCRKSTTYASGSPRPPRLDNWRDYIRA